MKLANRNIARKWYTPANYAELARNVMGAIDLDPCSDPIEQRTIQAENCFPATDGIERKWFGRVWLSPTTRGLSLFIDKLLGELEARRVSQAIVLAPNSTDTKWFHRAAPCARSLCFPKGRIKFLNAQGESRGGAISGQVFLYFGVDDTQFRRYFSKLGFIRPRRQPDVSQATY